MSEHNRREFVKKAALLTGGLMATPLFARTGFFPLGDDAIKVALVGCGGRGTGAAFQALSVKENVKLVAMADAFSDRIEDSYKFLTGEDNKSYSAEEINFVKARVAVPESNKFTGFDAYKKAIALADVVILTTPPGFRPLHFEEAVSQGKHVFMEKPVAVDPAGVQRVLAAAAKAKAAKLNVIVGLQRHYQRSYRELLDRIHDGKIGEVVGGQVYWNQGDLWVNPRQKGQTEMEYQMRNWYYFNWLSGDHIVEQHIHNLDVMNWAKQAYPVRAQGLGGRQMRTGKEYGEIFDHHAVEYHYADGTVMNSQCRQISGCYTKVDETIIGTKGTVFCDEGLVKLRNGKVAYRHNSEADKNPYQVEHDELFDAIAKGEFKFSDAENGAKSAFTAIMGRMATYSGQVIEWDKTLNSGLDIMPKTYAWDANPPLMPDANGFYPFASPGKTIY